MINRLQDKNDIEELYQQSQGKSAILILHGPSGIGKTYLTDNIFSDNELYPPYLRIRVNKQEAKETHASYISGLAKAFDRYAKEKGTFPSLFEFVQFIRESHTEHEKQINDIIDLALGLSDFKKIKLLKEKAHESFEAKKKQVDTILDALNEASRSVILEYISYITSKRKVIIALECIQYASDNLIAFLNELMAKTTNLFLIGEYTTKDYDVSDLISRFPDSKTEVLKLNKIDKDELISAAKARIQGPEALQVCEIIENSYGNTPGNLAHLNQLLKENYRKWKLNTGQTLGAIEYDKAIHYTYLSLSEGQKMMLWYILVHHGKVSKVLLTKLFEFLGYTSSHVDQDISELLTQDLVKYHAHEDIISIFHDSLFNLLKEETDRLKFSLIANRDWLEFYKKIILSNDYMNAGLAKHDVLLMQLSFIVNLGGSSSIDWMNVILKQIGGSLNVNHSESIISKLVSTFYYLSVHKENEKITYEAYENVVKLLFRLGYSEQICALQKMYSPQEKSDLLKLLQFSARISTCDKGVINELNGISDTKTPFLYQGGQLLQIKYYRTFSQIHKAHNIWKKLNKNSKTGDPYQPLILSYCNVSSFNIFKRLEYLEAAKKIFQGTEDRRHLCSTLLNINANLYHQYILNLVSKRSFLRTAHGNFDQARSILTSDYYPLNEFQNNRMILQLVEGKQPLEEISNGFHLANAMCCMRGNKSVIASNIIGIALKLKMTDNLEVHVNELMNKSREQIELNCEFAKYSLLNCYNYFREKNDKIGMREAIYFFKKGAAIGTGSEYLFSVPFLFEALFRYKKYHFMNIMNWDIDFDSLSSSF